MSDVMLFGVLRMPLEMAMGSELSRYQFHARAQEAADRIERLEAKLELVEAAALAASTSPEAFENWARDPIRADKLPLAQHANGAYSDTRSYIAYYGWKSCAKHLAALLAPDP